ncbi:class I adenylate-forming enzyme family protein [Jatrophihabitans sp.]|jgi:acyl-CoA synthetase (AMP-forming)/AMP-acid ligase II|uniref:class I adenylate-forming enzyme family protein n=1 Tax=Jatrophihabitans sp. TaxID=1932789 RepID=UPI002EF2770C
MTLLDPELIEGFLSNVGTTWDDKPEPGSFSADVAQLRGLEIPTGAVLTIALPNGMPLLRIFFAVLAAGYVPLLMAPSTPAARVRASAVQFGAHGLIRSRITAADHPGGRMARIADLDVLIFDTPGLPVHEPGQVILLTTGTSGAGTGCLHDYQALLRNADRHAASVLLTGRDTVLVNLPMYYSFALVAQILGCLRTGARPVLAGPPFQPAGYVGQLERHGVTVSSLTPILLSALLDSGCDLPDGLRTLTVGGSALPPDRVRQFLDRYPGKQLYLTYGLTEAGPRVSTLAAHAEPATRFASAGRPLQGVRIRLRDVGRGPRAQEVLVESDTIYRARLGKAAEERGGLAAPGVLATGDLGYLDDEGYLYLTGRASDFAVVRGEKVSLSSIRRTAESLAGVLRARPSVRAVETSDALLELDLYLDESAGVDQAGLRRALFLALAPSERPAQLRMHCLSAGSLYK